MNRYAVTYDIVTPESAAEGDSAERGFLAPGGWPSEDRPEPMSLREALDLVSPTEASSTHAHAGLWFSSEPRPDYRTGDYETRSLHRNPMTERHARRLAKLLRINLR